MNDEMEEAMKAIVKTLKNNGKMKYEEFMKEMRALPYNLVGPPDTIIFVLDRMQRWNLVQIDSEKKNIELTAGLFFHYIEKTVLELCKHELDAVTKPTITIEQKRNI